VRSDPLLLLQGVSAGYGELTILQGVDLSVAAGETLCVIGRNGMGKTTLLRTIVGQTRLLDGKLVYAGRDLSRSPPLQRARLGIGFVPQEREVFPNLTVEENLRVADQHKGWRLERSWELFPRLAERRAHLGRQLSGGEQQMLSIARALMGDPDLLLLDEPSEGLAPVIIDELFRALGRLIAQKSLAVLLVEQHVRRALEFAPRAIAMTGGRIVYDGESAPLLSEPGRLDHLVGLSVT